MVCTPGLPQKSRRYSTPAIGVFVIFLALQLGYSEENIAPQEPAKITTAPARARLSTRPFSHLALGISAGSLGIGIEAATPLSRRTNLRVDGHFFNYSPTFSQDGIDYTGTLRLRDFRASYDFFPFGGGFRLSGGVAVYNQFNVRASGSAPGKTITLNDVDYISSAINPLRGNATLAYGNKVAPTFTFGFGNIIPRSGRHLAFPVEIGAAFAGTPKFAIDVVSGVVCDQELPPNCQSVTNDKQFQTDKDAQIKKINNDIAPFRFYPILSSGVTYRF